MRVSTTTCAQRTSTCLDSGFRFVLFGSDRLLDLVLFQFVIRRRFFRRSGWGGRLIRFYHFCFVYS